MLNLLIRYFNFFANVIKLVMFRFHIFDLNVMSNRINFLLSLNLLCYDFSLNLSVNNTILLVEHLKIQELVFLSEYFLITALFCITLFSLFSLRIVVEKHYFLIKFQYENQLNFLLIFVLFCYLILIYQQINVTALASTSFHDTIYNDQLAIISKLVIGVSSFLYLIFITQYLKDQKLSNFEYYIILLVSIFGFFLLCCVNDFITAYLAIELQGLAFYVLASFKKSSNFSVESGVKYFVLGSLSTALFLLGITFIYGLSGSVLLTDFKDFFIWVFSANGFFLSFESFFKISQFFQEETFLKNNDNFEVLKQITDRLTLFREDVNVEKLTMLPNNINFYYLENHSNQIINLKNIDILSFSINDFFISNSCDNILIESFDSLKSKQLNYLNFITLKNELSQINYYEDLFITNFSQTFIENFKNELFSFRQVNKNILNDSNLFNFYDSLCCCCFSLIKFSSNLVHDSNYLMYNKSCNFLISPFNGTESTISQSYLFSLFNVINTNAFFFEVYDLNNIEFQTVFDISFAIFGVLIILLALFFKLALAPFHLWSPDVYEGSPSSSTFFFMVISKFSIFVFLVRICYLSFYSMLFYWQSYSLLVATVSIFIGAVAGLKQRKLKSLLTYSSINNMGFVLLAFSVGSFEGIQIKFYYLIVYVISSLCMWSIILNLKLQKKMYFEKQNRDLGDFALLQESNNIIAQNLGVTLFSLAGLPPMVGFLAKMGVFKALNGISLYYFSIINILFSVIATFYYLRIVKIIFFENLLIGNLYATLNSKKVFIINFLTFYLVFLFFNPMFLYLYSYKITLFFSKSFY